MSRRIKKELKDFLDAQDLIAEEKSFIVGCIKAQSKYPQLTARQWQIVMDIVGRYRKK